MVAKEYDFIGGMKIHPVVQPHRWRHALIVEFNDLDGNPSAVESISQYINAGCGNYQPQTIYFFTGMDKTCHIGKRNRAKNGQQAPPEK